MGSVIQFPARASAAPPPDAHPVRLGAQHWEHQFGRDAYSAFLLKHGRRPDPKQAEVIGKIVGRRVKASDGFRYPKLTRTAARLSPDDDRKKWQRIKRLHRKMTKSNSDSQPQPPP